MAIKTKYEEQAAGVQATPASGFGTGPSTAFPALPGTNGSLSALNDTITQTAASFQTTQARMKEGMDKAMKSTEEFMAFGQGNFEAMVKSGQIWATGLQDLGKQVAATAQAHIEETMSAFKAIAGAKTVKDAFEVQTSLARTAIEKTLAESSRLTESSIKLTEQALAPVTARVTLAVEKFGQAA
ncbi:MAG: phasin family protein [Acetobacteraceae bacterium]